MTAIEIIVIFTYYAAIFTIVIDFIGDAIDFNLYSLIDFPIVVITIIISIIATIIPFTIHYLIIILTIGINFESIEFIDQYWPTNESSPHLIIANQNYFVIIVVNTIVIIASIAVTTWIY